MEKNEIEFLHKHEQRMINEFRGCCDWEQLKHRKFKEPTKGFRDLFRRMGYKVYLVNEFRTSLHCARCQQEDGKCRKYRIERDIVWNSHV